MWMESSKTLMNVVAVIFARPAGKVAMFVLLDVGYTITLMEASIARKLGLQELRKSSTGSQEMGYAQRIPVKPVKLPDKAIFSLITSYSLGV